MQSRRERSLAPKATTIALLVVVVAAIVGVLVATILLVVAPHSARADHDSMYLVCPDPIPEGNTASMGVKRPGHRVVYAYYDSAGNAASLAHAALTADPAHRVAASGER